MADKQLCAHERRVARRKDIEKRPRRRYILPNTWVFISSRTCSGQFLFSEFDEEDHALVAGLYIVAMKRYGVQVAAHVMMSGHIHALMRAKHGKRISLAMQYVKAGIARLVHRKRGTSGP
ncbi:MAG: transposase, partial [Myxococcales bacterium]|nr:transposase [Myxococcales bacterium]